MSPFPQCVLLAVHSHTGIPVVSMTMMGYLAHSVFGWHACVWAASTVAVLGLPDEVAAAEVEICFVSVWRKDNFNNFSIYRFFNYQYQLYDTGLEENVTSDCPFGQKALVICLLRAIILVNGLKEQDCLDPFPLGTC